MTGYKDLSVENKLRVNAEILDSISENKNGFINDFRKMVIDGKKHGLSHDDAFQRVVDGLRANLAADLANLPKVTHVANHTAHQELDTQGDAFREMRRLMSSEQGTPSHPYRNASEYQGVAKHEFMPKQQNEYHQEGSVTLLKTRLQQQGWKEDNGLPGPQRSDEMVKLR